MKQICCFLLSLLMLIGMSGCSDASVDVVKEGTLDFDRGITVGKALDNYRFFKSVEWRSFESAQGRSVVEFKGVVDAQSMFIKDDAIMFVREFERGELKSFRAAAVNGDIPEDYVFTCQFTLDVTGKKFNVNSLELSYKGESYKLRPQDSILLIFQDKGFAHEQMFNLYMGR